MINALVTKIFNDLSNALEILNVPFKPLAYSRAARAIEGLSKDVSEIYKEGGLKGLDEIPGVGSNLSKKIEEIIKTGMLKYHEALMSEIPFNFNELMMIRGIGPKTAKTLYERLGITDLRSLKKACTKGLIKSLPGFGERTEQKIKENLKFAFIKKRRVYLGTAYDEAESIINALKPHSRLIEIAGSLRRMKETIGDIDVLAVPKNKNLVNEFLKLGKVISKGGTKCSIRLASGINADLRLVKALEFGSALQYFTGSKDHNVALRVIAKSGGYKLSEYGLFKGSKRVAGASEAGVYDKLGLQFIPPELRENKGEIEQAGSNEIPDLIAYDSIKGDLQCHTTHSDGLNSIEEMAVKAKSLGYEYLGFTDHAGNLSIAGSLSERDLIKESNEIRCCKVEGIKLLAGAEVNILEDGRLDVHDRVLKSLDFVVASIHAKFNLSKQEQTKRLVRAMENPYVNVIGHPTGRKILYKQGIEFDWSEVFEASKKNNTYLEINSYPERLDLSDSQAYEAIKAGCNLVINTDAHSIEHLDYVRYGVGTARRAWARKSDVINTQTLKGLLKTLNK